MKIDNSVAITFRAVDSYASDINGFGGSTWTAADKRLPAPQHYTRYANPAQGELLLGPNNLVAVALGLENSSGLCFFAAGVAPPSVPAGAYQYMGQADGFGVIGGTQKRFLTAAPDELPTMNIDFAARTAHLEWQIVGRNDPFGDFAHNARDAIGTVSADLSLAPGTSYFNPAPLTGAGFTGTVQGQIVGGPGTMIIGPGAAAALVFSITRPNGDMIFGSIALVANVM